MSKVLIFYTIDEPNNTAKCKKCKKTLKYVKKQTKGLWDHLGSCSKTDYEKHHPKYANKIEIDKQQNLLGLGFNKVDPAIQRQKQKEELVAGIVLRQNAALSFVEDVGVKQMFKDAYPDLKVFKRYCK